MAASPTSNAEPKPEWWDDWSNTDHALILVHSGGQPSGYYVFPVDRDRGDWYSIYGGSNLSTGFTRFKARMEHTVWTRVATITEARRLCKLPPLEESKVEAVDDPFHISRELVLVNTKDQILWHFVAGQHWAFSVQRDGRIYEIGGVDRAMIRREREDGEPHVICASLDAGRRLLGWEPEPQPSQPEAPARTLTDADAFAAVAPARKAVQP